MDLVYYDLSNPNICLTESDTDVFVIYFALSLVAIGFVIIGGSIMKESGIEECYCCKKNNYDYNKEYNVLN